MTAQFPSKVRLAQIASFSKSMVLPPSHDEIEAMARALLAAHEQEPVPNYVGSKNALDAIVAFIKSSSNPTLSDYNSVSERLFADNCQSLSSHVIEYITHIGEALEEFRQDATNPAPVPAVPDDWRSSLQEPVGYFGRFDPDDEDLIDQCSKNVKGSFPLYLHAQQAVVPEILDYQMAKELYNYLMTKEEINATVNGWNACRAAMLNGGKS